jgi:hypothetical protein
MTAPVSTPVVQRTKVSLRKAIDEKCKDCIYDPLCGGGTWREQIAQCTALDCPLWPVRTGPESGPFAAYPTDRESVTPEWLNATTDALRRAGESQS